MKLIGLVFLWVRVKDFFLGLLLEWVWEDRSRLMFLPKWLELEVLKYEWWLRNNLWD